MEQKFSNNSLDLQTLREFCEREGEEIAYRNGDQMEWEGATLRGGLHSSQKDASNM